MTDQIFDFLLLQSRVIEISSTPDVFDCTYVYREDNAKIFIGMGREEVMKC